MSVEPDHTTLPLPKLDPSPRVLIVAAPYHRAIVEGLASGASAKLREAGAHIERLDAPGALELPTMIRLASDTSRFDGYIALGCVIRGETTHYEIVSNESAAGLMRLGVDRGLAIGNGVLTVENREQAEVRADPAQLDKGGEAALACLHLIAAIRRFGGDWRPQDEHILLA
ncbi:MAG: 6,7-dimethyl-8-ribityllumazine synthase [Neomegalonema sp.]|nr:6,7-dimethyl-8-ribityllumazine synthase [Neomegalonema sp.]